MNPFVKLDRIKFSCEKCTNEYYDLETLNKHIHTHSIDEIDVTNENWLAHITSAKVILEGIKIFKCKQCTQCFEKVRDYRLHKLKHIQQHFNEVKKINYNNDSNSQFVKRFKCDDCSARFVLESTLIAHSIIHAPFNYVCECGIGYYSKKDYTGHRNLIHPSVSKVPWKPKINYSGPKVKANHQTYDLPTESEPKVEKRSGVMPKLRAVLRTKVKKEQRAKRNPEQTTDIKQDVNKKYLCPQCNKTFNAKNNAIIHLRIHTGEKPYACDKCDMRFTQSGALKVHLKSHSGVKDNFCRYCNKGFANYYSVLIHERTHTGEKPYNCTHCGKPFSDPSALRRHIRTHTGEKPYSCEVCSMKFSDASGLIRHRQTHDAKRGSTCEICDKHISYVFMSSHLMLHSNLKQYECDYCGKKFAIKNYLVSHILRMHSGDIHCKKCNARFCSKSDLRKHAWKGCFVINNAKKTKMKKRVTEIEE